MADPSTPGGAAVHVRSYPGEREAHAHPFHQLVLPVAGRLELEVQGRAGRVADLSCVLVPAGERHAFAGSGENRFVVLDVPCSLVDEVGAGAWLDLTSRSNFFAAPRTAMLLATLLAEDGSVEASPPEVHRAWATLVLRAAAAEGSRARPATVERALAFIEARALGAVRVADVARAARVSSGQLHALFRAHVGQTPHEAVLARRLAAARELLLRTDAPIAEIALRCGFADQATLTHAMRRVTGTTPGRLRRIHG